MDIPNPISIPIVDADGTDSGFKMKLVCPKSTDYVLISKDEAEKYTEARDQILEGVEYDYAFEDGEMALEEHQVVFGSRFHPNEGQIRTGNFVGRLRIKVRRRGALVGFLDLQVRSRKIGYRDQYHKMLEDIAREAAELVMSSSEATSLKFEVDPSTDSKTLYEQFAFVRSLLQSDAFLAAMGRICNSPITAMKDVRESRRTDSLRRMSRDVVRQLVSAGNRQSLPEGHPLRANLPNVPRYVEMSSREETVDVQENRFVKFVLTTFRDFADSIAVHPKSDSRLRESARHLVEEIGNYLLEPLFREVSDLDRMVSSPALQRREGYREILRTWLMFGMAAKVGWDGGEDVYGAGNRNIAVLYEYWAFFELLRIVSSVFSIDRSERRQLLVQEKKGLELSLKRGKAQLLKGVYAPRGCERPLEVRLHYNKTFPAVEDFTKAGSWTVDMRPDYTVSLWPQGLSEIVAEQMDAIVHIHFDAKYRIDKFKDVFEKDPNAAPVVHDADNHIVQQALNALHQEEDEGNFKRGDLLKMHSYNDSIRRTYGSYILYPGEGEEEIHRYREIIPGIGAFVLKPDARNAEPVGSMSLKLFLQKVAKSLQDRLTQHERMAKYHHLVHRNEPVPMPVRAMRLKLPLENTRSQRPFIPAEEYVLVGYYKSQEHLRWILANAYNFRLGDVRGSVHLTRGMTDADYILLHGPGEAAGTDKLYRIVRERSGIIWSRNDFAGKGYPGPGGLPSGNYYLMYRLEVIYPGQPMHGGKYDVTKLNGYKSGRQSSEPFETTFFDLLSHGVV